MRNALDFDRVKKDAFIYSNCGDKTDPRTIVLESPLCLDADAEDETQLMPTDDVDIAEEDRDGASDIDDERQLEECASDEEASADEEPLRNPDSWELDAEHPGFSDSEDDTPFDYSSDFSC